VGGPPVGVRHVSRQALLLGVVVSLSASALLAIGILLFGDFGETEGRILATTALLAAYGVLALPAGALLDRALLPVLAATLLLLSAAGFAGAVAAVWTGDPPDELGNGIATVTVFGVACAQIAALAVRRRARDPASVRRLFRVSTGLVLAVAALVSAAIWAETEHEAYLRVVAALAVLDVLLAALQPILALARPAGGVYRIRLVVESGEVVETTIEAPDLAAAAARTIRSVESGGRRVVRLERVPPHGS
jgi:hypothetical protein